MSVFTNPAASASEHAHAYVDAVLRLLGDRDPLQVFRETPVTLSGQLLGLPPEVIARPEAPGTWSIRDVIQHLADSELVWGYRIRMVLAHDRPPLTGYDQDLWAERLHYSEADYQQALMAFTMLRGMNLRILERASADDLRRAGVHAERGEQTLGEMIRLYAGHDLVHLRQVQRIADLLGGGPAGQSF